MTKILVVDDEPEVADSMAFLLERLGHDVRVTYSGPEALPMAASFVPHIILLDLLMPIMDGFEAARQIRAASIVTDHPFIVAVTGMADKNIASTTRDAGIDAYIVKPADLTILLMIVDSLQWRDHPSKPGALPGL